MPAIANIVINDNAAVAHTFVPFSTSPQKCVWRTQDPTLPFIAQKSITMEVSKSSNGVYTVRVVVEVPIQETVSGAVAGYVAAPKVAYSLKSDTKFFIPERATGGDRSHIWSFSGNLNASALINGVTGGLSLPF